MTAWATNRMLTYPSMRTGPEFYAPKNPELVMSQQAILYASGYPSAAAGRSAAPPAINPQQYWWPGLPSSSRPAMQ